jgi:hypothetical protein
MKSNAQVERNPQTVAREKRVAAALRENLRKRKQQQNDRAAGADLKTQKD